MPHVSVRAGLDDSLSSLRRHVKREILAQHPHAVIPERNSNPNQGNPQKENLGAHPGNRRPLPSKTKRKIQRNAQPDHRHQEKERPAILRLRCAFGPPRSTRDDLKRYPAHVGHHKNRVVAHVSICKWHRQHHGILTSYTRPSRKTFMKGMGLFAWRIAYCDSEVGQVQPPSRELPVREALTFHV